MGVKPGGWATNDVPTAAEINSYFQQRDEWDDYSPALTLTNVTVGNGTKTARYNQVGRIVHFLVKFQLNTTSSVSGVIGVSLPVAAARLVEVFGVQFFDASVGAPTGAMIGSHLWSSSTKIDLCSINPALAYTSSTVPFTWTTLDWFSVSGTYEAASAP